MKNDKMSSVYTQKVLLPIFEPNNKNVELDDLVDVDKYVSLLKEIDKDLQDKKITEQESKFLKLCATRWIKFNFSNVAQFYATKASENFQRLLERSAMVLIDMNKAFENEIIYSNHFIKNIGYNQIDDSLKIESYIEDNKKVLEDEC